MCATFASGLVAGCSSAAPTPKPLASSTTSSATPSSSPTPSVSSGPPALPAAARGHTDASAQAFVQHYFRLINYASANGDTAALDELSSRRCQSCVGISRLVGSIYSAGGSISSAGWRIVKVSRPIATGHERAFNLVVSQSPERIREAAGARLRRTSGGRQPMAIYLKPDGASWMVRRLDLVG